MSSFTSTVYAIVSDSVRLRDAELARLLTRWGGESERKREPGDGASLLNNADTPSLFAGPVATVARVDDNWLKRNGEALLTGAGRAPVSGIIVLLAPAIDGKTALAKRLDEANALTRCATPWALAKPWEIERVVRTWLTGVVRAHPQGAQRVPELVDCLVSQLGHDYDGLLGAIDQLAIAADDQPISPDLAPVIGAVPGESLPYQFAEAVLNGKADTAIAMIDGRHGLSVEGALSGLTAELRRVVGCAESPDDAEAARRAGVTGRSTLTRSRAVASRIGVAAAKRLLGATVRLSIDTRGGGGDMLLATIALVLHARRLVKPN